MQELSNVANAVMSQCSMLCEFSESSLHSRWKYKDGIHEDTLTGEKCHNVATKCGNVVNKIS